MSEPQVCELIAGYHSRIFEVHLKQIAELSDALHMKKRDDIGQLIDVWKHTWENSRDQISTIERSSVLKFGLELVRVAEAYSHLDVAQNILDELAEDAIADASWIPDPAEILIQAGEFSRRLGKLDRAESRFHAAVELLERTLTQGNGWELAHRRLGRAFYEFAYVHHCRGDAGAARSAFERSEVECLLGGDPVGVEVAKSMMASIYYEEGSIDTAVTEHEARLHRFQTLETDPTIITSGRAGLARRWIPNVKTDLALSYLAAGKQDLAQRIIDDQLSYLDNQPSITGVVIIKRAEALLRLAEGDVVRARDAIEMSWTAASELNELRSVELAAATIAIAGLVHELGGSRSAALSCFRQACELPPNMHNRTAQGWAWAGRALLAVTATERRGCVIKGLEMVERCGAPIRAFLLAMMHDSDEEGSPLNLDHLRELICRSG